MTHEVTDVWFRSPLRLTEIARRLGLRDVTDDFENYWEWAIGTLGDARLDVTRTHTRPRRQVDTRIFLLEGEFTDSLLAEVVGRLREFVPGVIRCGRWVYRSGNEFDLVVVREFGPAVCEGTAEPHAPSDRPHAVEQPMPTVDELTTLIRDRRHDEALALLNASPGLAAAHSEAGGQLHGASPLHWAAHRNAVTVCRRLIELGANVNDSASDWWLTPLAWAADAGSADAVQLLLKLGADVNQDAVVGTTALHAVAMGGSSRGSANPDAYRRTAEILIAHGADVNRRATGDRGQTPLDDALVNHNDAVAAVLRQHGGRPPAPGLNPQ
jgi:hypothetical protein